MRIVFNKLVVLNETTKLGGTSAHTHLYRMQKNEFMQVHQHHHNQNKAKLITPATELIRKNGTPSAAG